MQIELVSLIYIIGAVQSAFILFMLITKKKKKIADFYLSGFFMVVIAYLLFAYYSTQKLYYAFPNIVFFACLITLFYGPLLFFYVKSLIGNYKLSKKDIFHTIPFIINYIAFIPLFFNSDEDKLALFDDKFMHLPFYITVAYSVQFISALVYFVWIIHIILKHNRNILNQQSSIEKINLRWLQAVLAGAIAIWILEIVKMYIANYTAHPYPVIIAVSARIGYVVFIFFLGYFGLKQGDIFVSSKREEDTKLITNSDSNTEASKTKEKIISNEKSKEYELKLKEYMDKDKPYLNSELRLVDISINLKIPAHVLSYILNQKLNINFYDFVNSYRVKEAKHRLLDKDNKQFTILAIAYDCGFNSKASFNRIFKKQCEQTPSEYQKRMTPSLA